MDHCYTASTPQLQGGCSPKSLRCGEYQSHKLLPVTACLDLERYFTLQKSLLWETKGIWLWYVMDKGKSSIFLLYHSKMMEFNSLGPKFSTSNRAALIKSVAISLHALYCSLKQAFVSVSISILQCLPPFMPT